LRQQSGKELVIEIGQSNLERPPNTIARDEERSMVVNDHGSKGITGMHRTLSEETFKIKEEEYTWGFDFVREMGTKNDQQLNANSFRSLKVEFPKYDGGDSIE
jgi:hypothetical protein